MYLVMFFIITDNTMMPGDPTRGALATQQVQCMQPVLVEALAGWCTEATHGEGSGCMRDDERKRGREEDTERRKHSSFPAKNQVRREWGRENSGHPAAGQWGARNEHHDASWNGGSAATD